MLRKKLNDCKPHKTEAREGHMPVIAITKHDFI